MRAIFVATVFLGGCLNDLVPLHSSSPQTQRGADLAGAAAVDAGGPGPSPDLASASTDLAPKNCIDKIATLADGHHNPGQDCLTCHSALNPGISQFTVAGTLYDSLVGTNPVPGATIEITDNAGTKLLLTTALNGNFYTINAVQLPLAPRASGCPDNQVMTGTAPVGSCNSCHNATTRIHLP